MLRYERAIGCLAEAGAAFQAGRGTQGVDRVGRADVLVGELAEGLDLAGGGELARQRAGLYRYCRQRLAEAARTRQAGPVLEVAGLLEGLLAAWRKSPAGISDSGEFAAVSGVPSPPRTGAEAQEALRLARDLILSPPGAELARRPFPDTLVGA